jgi:hypothetical protein
VANASTIHSNVPVAVIIICCPMGPWLKIDCSEKPYIYDTVKKRYLLLLILFIATVCSSQARPKPSWMTELPLPGNNTYIYVKEAG